MVDRARFDRIKKKHGGYASWAVWANASDKPKSNIGDMRVLDPDQSPTLLQILRNDVIMLGLNVSGRLVPEPLRNFHDPSPVGQDYKIRYAFAGTGYYGAYMTDFIKEVQILKSTDLLRHLRLNPSAVRENLERLLEEFDDLGCEMPTILTFGTDTYQLVADSVPPTKYSRLIGLTHYSHYISKEEYRKDVLRKTGHS
jgi:hypothetical protein